MSRLRRQGVDRVAGLAERSRADQVSGLRRYWKPAGQVVIYVSVFLFGVFFGALYWPVHFWVDWKRTRTRKYYE